MSDQAPVSAGSVSRIECVASIRDAGEAKVSLYRHLAPLTVNAIARSLPFYSRTNLQGAVVSLFTDIKVGVEKPRTAFQRGEVAFLASAGLLCVFLKDSKSDRPLNPVGKVEDGLETFDSLKLGAVVKLSTLQPVQ